MKKITIYWNEIFDSELLVCCGVSAKDIKKWANSKSKNLRDILKTKENFELMEKTMEINVGFLQFFTKDRLKYYILWLKDYKNDWKYFDILNHEIVHYRQFQFADKNIKDEVEFEAYFQESVFRGVRRLLNKFLK